MGFKVVGGLLVRVIAIEEQILNLVSSAGFWEPLVLFKITCTFQIPEVLYQYILLTYFQQNGDVMIPDVLQKYMNGKEKLEKMEKRTKYVQANKIARMITE